MNQIPLNSLPDWEKGDKLWIRVSACKTILVQQLAKQATDKQKKTWKELIPPKYHSFGSIFSEKASERFPDHRKWDYAIDLKADVPTSIDCRVYPLSLKEWEEQKEFLESNLWLNRICHSSSPLCQWILPHPKKDGKFQPVQDYCCLNKWTIPNHYPLLLIVEFIHNLAEKRVYSSSMYNGDTTMSKSKKETSGKLPLKPVKNYLNPWLCSSALQTHQQPSKPWWMTSFMKKLHKDGLECTWTISLS